MKKNVKEWSDEVQRTRNDMIFWATGIRNTWKSHAIFLGILSSLLVITLLLHWLTLARIMGIIIAFQVGRIVWSKIKND